MFHKLCLIPGSLICLGLRYCLSSGLNLRIWKMPSHAKIAKTKSIKIVAHVDEVCSASGKI